MTMRLIIAHPSPTYCKDLSRLFSGKVAILSTDEVITSEELEWKLNIEPADVVIIEQSLLKDLSFWPEGTVIVVARKPERDAILAAFARGARGYFLETGKEKFLTLAVAARPGEFWLDPSLARWFFNELASREGLQNGNIVLTRRERDIFKLKEQHLTTQEIAKKLSISEKTVKKHVEHIHRKLAGK